MRVFTIITKAGDEFHVSQHRTTTPEHALALHVGQLPHDDGGEEGDEEIDWVVRVASGKEPVQLLALPHCARTWIWLDGARRERQYSTYIVQTDLA